MRFGSNMMPMFLTVFLSDNEQHFTEVPVTPETTCRDVVDLCKEPGESECHLAEVRCGSERPVADNERMFEALQRSGSQRNEVRFFLRHERPPGRDTVSGPRSQDPSLRRNGVKVPGEHRRKENGAGSPGMDLTLAELQEMASRQQQQIEAQQQMLATKEQRLKFLKQQDERQQQQAAEQEKLKRLKEIAESQEAKLKKVRALRGHVEQKRLKNGRLVEEIEQMNSLFQQKQRELVLAVSKVEELGRQLEVLKNGRLDGRHDGRCAAAELDRLYKELQLRNKLNQEQNAKLQQQRECLNKRNSEVAVMDKRVNELRDRLWKKKAALQHKEGPPVDGTPPPQGLPAPSRVAAVGPYIQSSTMPRVPSRPELVVKPALPDGPGALQASEGALRVHTLPSTRSAAAAQARGSKIHPLSPDWSPPSADVTVSQPSGPAPTGSGRALDQGGDRVDDGEVPLREKEKKVRPFSMLDSVDQSAGPAPCGGLRKNQSSEDILRDAQGKRTNLRKTGSDRIAHGMRVKFNPLALLLDSSLEGEFDLVQRIIYEVDDPSLPNDEGITALHNAVCAGHTEIVKFLVQFGVNVNAADSDGWTPLHCAASCNNVQVCKFLVESGAAVFATTYSDTQTAADKCEEVEEGYAQCSQFLYGVQEKMGIMNKGVLYALWDYEPQHGDELPLREGDCLAVLRREDEEETEWWWARLQDQEGYVPRNLLGLYPRIKPRQRSLA
ncbi:apoptosis-stimulating of p53 protein 2 isoform X6 [Acinonyx jubatus]|uniref:Apoptosis-stimulating of p53 protein 2 isoform X6 n=1 Tax=Acinonyx jubatus TaxID=32536 RepID=A0ABM3P2C1_ACIJB|nr:apoptosis-stimulating of p53 protein 2 isoform X6 [Acinonyx jubatus]